jgi:hypothetical protein
MKKQKTLVDFIRGNYNWLIALTTVVALITSQIIRFVNYIKFEMYKGYFGLDITNINYGTSDLIYGTIISAMLLACFYSMLFCYKEIIPNLKNKKYGFLYINIVIILFVNYFFIIFNTQAKFNIKEYIILICAEVLILIFSSKMRKKYIDVIDKIKNKEDLKNYAIIMPFTFIFFILSISYLSIPNYNKNTEFRIINNNQVVVYYDDTDYIVLNCEIKGVSIKIYYGTQKRISSLDTETKKIKFDTVSMEK